MIHWFIGSLLRCFIDSQISWFIDWSIHPLIHWFIASFLHGITASSIHWFMDSSTHWFIDSFSHLCMESFMSFYWHLGNRLLMCWYTSQLQHFVASASQNFPIGHHLPIVGLNGRNFRPGTGGALPGICGFIPCIEHGGSAGMFKCLRAESGMGLWQIIGFSNRVSG